MIRIIILAGVAAVLNLVPLNGRAQSGDMTTDLSGGSILIAEAPQKDKSKPAPKTIIGGFKSLSGMDSETEVIENKIEPDEAAVKRKGVRSSGDANPPSNVAPR